MSLVYPLHIQSGIRQGLGKMSMLGGPLKTLQIHQSPIQMVLFNYYLIIYIVNLKELDHLIVKDVYQMT